MGLTLQNVLVRALKKLTELGFQRFIEKLSVWKVREEYKSIPKEELKGKDPEEVVSLINEYYKYVYGAEVTLDVLEDIKEIKVREELQRDLQEVDVAGHGLGTVMFTDRVTFIENHRSELVCKITEVDPVLRDLWDQDLLREEQYKDVMDKRRSSEKMRELCDVIRHWEDTGKYTAYRSLKQHHEEVIKDLEAEERKSRNPPYVWCRDHFVNRHQYHLIHNIREVNAVIDDLRSNHLLTAEQCEVLRVMTRPKNKMRYLWDIFRHQSDTMKDQFYISLWRYNYTVINNLERPSKEPRHESPLPDSTPYVQQRIPPHEEPASPDIKMALMFHEVLVRALKKLENSSFQRFLEELSVWAVRKQYRNIPEDDLMEKDPEHVTGLIIEYYGCAYGAKVTLAVLENIKEKKVREELQEDLIGVQQRTPPHDKPASPDIKMALMFHEVLVRALKKLENSSFQRFLEELSVWAVRKQYRNIPEDDLMGKDPEHVTGLIIEYYGCAYGAKVTLAVLENIKEKKVREELQEDLIGVRDHFVTRHEMELIDNIEEVNDVIDDLQPVRLLSKKQYKRINVMTSPRDKMRHLYNIIRHKCYTMMDQFYFSLRKYNYSFINKLEKRDKEPKSITSQTPEGQNISPMLSTLTQEGKEANDPQTRCVNMTIDDFSCKLCGKRTQDSAELVTPITTGHMYRLDLTSPGLYRCQKTGIKFLVKCPVIIEYKLDSWYDKLRNLSSNAGEVVGPLFDIKTRGDSNAVSAVYLPHYLCLKGFTEDTALIKCAHFRDGNLTLETPTQIDPIYITLENPTFSCLGSWKLLRNKKTPIHGIVLIYFKIQCRGDPYEESKIHLYTLKFHSEPFQFTEIRLLEKDVNVFLCVSEEDKEDSVWDSHLTPSDLRDITQLLSPLTIHEVAGAGPSPEHFVDRHREALIQRTSNLSLVLDKILGQRLLTQEQYDTVRSIRPHQEAMRQLYKYMTIWGDSDKEMFYQALKMTNEPLIRDLENKDTIKL
ncbi:uncharacterized protein LOC142204278 [Leptodactylus fuscus]|uniref:uncharacterized protein LOC142204278 n=1 Tax=Leptodactylus fuscus TaxID=238119 RepID=UPI003F4E953C